MINLPDSSLKDFIHVEKNFIPENTCDFIIENIEKREWKKHTWYDVTVNTFNSEDTKELDVQKCSQDLQNKLTPFLNDLVVLYNQKYSFSSCSRTRYIVNKFSKVRFNRYNPGQMMRQHMDHIQSLFDGFEKGIPVLSFIINLNDEYDGGDLYFWNDYKIPLGKGDCVIFPSVFMYPHGVTEVIKGKRYSAVSWAW